MKICNMKPLDKVKYQDLYADVVSIKGNVVNIKYYGVHGKVTKKVDKSELIKIGNGN
jgi:hypothetical protein